MSVRHVLWNIATYAAGRRAVQPLFHLLHRIALAGMNVGCPCNVGESGEWRVLRLIARLFPSEAPTVFDVGANVGHYSRAVLRELPNARLHSFEPSPKTYQQLQGNLAGTTAQLHNMGMSRERGVATLFGANNDSALSSLHKRQLGHVGLAVDSEEQAILGTIDEFCAERNLARIHLLKLDVEGHELSVLQGAASMLGRDAIDVIQFEFGGCNVDSRTYLRDFYELFGARYTLYRVLPHGIVPLGAYREQHEIFMTTNYLAVHRRHGAL